MSILNVNQIQPVGGGNTITVSASDVSASGVTITASSFVGPLTGNVTGNITGNVTGNITGTTSNASGATGDFSIADKIVHTGDTNTAIRFPAADTFTVETAGIERARVNAGGVLLGLTAAVGEGGTPADLNSTEVGRGFINLARDDTAAADHILIGKNGSIAASIGTDTTNTLVFKTGTSERLRIDNVGSAQFTGGNSPSGLNTRISRYGSLLVATTGELLSNARCSIDSGNGNITTIGNLVVASGKGIDFSAAGNAGGMQSEILDDYEEGTYSASITMGTSGTVTMNSSYDTLSYTKIGRMVYVTGQIRVSSVSNPVGATLINLPFAVRNNISDARGGGTVTLYITGQAHYYWPLVYQIAESTSKINLTHNATGYFLPAAGNEYAISIMYIVS